MKARENAKYGLIKPAIDAHTLGVNSVAELLRDCGYTVVFAGEEVAAAMNDYRYKARRKLVIDWILANEIEWLGISYRLDYENAVNMVGYLIEDFKREGLFKYQGGRLDTIFFGGLPRACEVMDKEFKGLVITFSGGESVTETLTKLGVPENRIPKNIYEGSRYDDSRLEFGKQIIDSEQYRSLKPQERVLYPEYGTAKDTLMKRLDAGRRAGLGPLMRAHVGPYSSTMTREEAVQEFLHWTKALADARHLDILSIGSSQLTQSNFGEEWGDKANGGGVPINSPEEYRMIWEAAKPMLIRTYAGTKDIPRLARIHEHYLNICWHALSLWWFNKLDERGPYDLYTNLRQHTEAIRYIATTGKPLEANVPHHFSFRGGDDVTYIVSAYLSAKLAKQLGIRVFILQNMLNTPRSTWGVQDLAKSRAMLKLIKSLENPDFQIVLQPRAGLDYFKPNLYDAKIQLAAVTALMDDIDPYNELSPPIIHVVSYSEASDLATPEIINESIQITRYSLQRYRELRRLGKVEDMGRSPEVEEREKELYLAARKLITAIEGSMANPYTAEGFYKIFAAGFLPVPYLWRETEEFGHAKNWKTKPVRGCIKVINEAGSVMTTKERIDIALGHMKDAEYNLRQRQSQRQL